jgi:ubiquitin carboxyl-terminal hydrolase L3
VWRTAVIGLLFVAMFFYLKRPKKAGPAWVAMESDPRTMSNFMRQLGVSPAFHFKDVYGLDHEMLAMVPKPCFALVMLFPTTAAYVASTKQESAQLKDRPQDHGVLFVPQTVAGACGAISIVHAVVNNPAVGVQPGSILHSFVQQTGRMSPPQRADAFNQNASIIAAAGGHNRPRSTAATTQTPTQVVAAAEAAARASAAAGIAGGELHGRHYMTYICKGGRCLEFDGRKPCAIDRGPTSPETFLHDAARVIQEFQAKHFNGQELMHVRVPTPASAYRLPRAMLLAHGGVWRVSV